MITLESQIREELDNLVQELINKHNELGMKATGNWIDSLEVQTDNFSGSILGEPYTEQLTKGREPGKMPPLDKIETWVNAKFGITGKQGRGIAWAVAKKIAKEGTTWFKQGGTDLVESVINEDTVQKLYEDLGVELAIIINQDLQRQIQQIFAA